MIKVKHKLGLYSSYNVDIWGYLKNNLWRCKKKFFFYKRKRIKYKLRFRLGSIWTQSSIFMKNIVFYFFNLYMKKVEKRLSKIARYTYLLKKYELRQKRKKRYRNIDTLKLTLLFYVNITHRQFQKMALKAKKMDGFFEENYLYILEGRLSCLCYRSGLILNMFDAISFVKKGCVKVNGLIITNLNYIVTVMTIIGFKSICKGFLFLNFWKRLVRKLVFIYPPKFLYFFYKFFFFFLKRSPKRNDFIHPFHLDMYRAIGYGGYAK